MYIFTVYTVTVFTVKKQQFVFEQRNINLLLPPPYFKGSISYNKCIQWWPDNKKYYDLRQSGGL